MFTLPSVHADELHSAAFSGDMARIRMLLKAGANVNAKDKNGETALDIARFGMDHTEKSINPFLAVMELLKSHGGY